MQTHEHYEELCALLPIGQLSAEEYRELMEHLKACTSCQDATGDFSVILDKMPVGEAELDGKTITELQDDSYLERFLKRAVAQGVPISEAVMEPRFSVKKWTWPRLSLVRTLATAAALVVVILSVRLVRRSEKLPEVSRHGNVQPISTIAESSRGHNSRVFSALEAKVDALESDAIRQQRIISDLKSKLNESRSESEIAKRNFSKASERLSDMQRQAAETQQVLIADLDRARSEKNSADTALVDQQFKINQLAAQVKEKDALAERERQLDSVASDVRDLMGARNLHILDVSDVDGNGRSKKSFGRVFLVEGKSLIFYAFDLGNRGNPAKVSFQAWGQLEGRQTTAKNLGVFYVDDHAQKRWVLKVNDPEKLTAINSVFVTVEPLGGADRPTGKKLLYAYLGTQPNHP
jgi:uncharacterized coiled-coil protein SlyX